MIIYRTEFVAALVAASQSLEIHHILEGFGTDLHSRLCYIDSLEHGLGYCELALS